MKTVFSRQVMQQCCFLQLFRCATDAAHFCIDVSLTFKLAQLTCSESYSIQLHHFFPWNLWQFLVVKENSVVLFIHFVFAMNTIYLFKFFLQFRNIHSTWHSAVAVEIFDGKKNGNK